MALILPVISFWKHDHFTIITTLSVIVTIIIIRFNKPDIFNRYKTSKGFNNSKASYVIHLIKEYTTNVSIINTERTDRKRVTETEMSGGSVK